MLNVDVVAQPAPVPSPPAPRKAPRSRRRPLVVVAVDLDANASQVLRVAHREAMRRRALLAAVCVLPELGPSPVLRRRTASRVMEYPGLMTRSAQRLQRMVQQVTHRTARQFDVTLAVGEVHIEVGRLARERNADVVVVGRSSTADLTTALLGGTPTRVLRMVNCAVLVAGRPSAAKGVLAATDLTHPGVPVVRQAAAEAALRGTRLTVVHCVQDPPGVAARLAALRRISRCLGPLQEGPLQKAEVVVAHGDPVAAIAGVARRTRSGLIVVGARRRPGVRRLLTGSVAEQLLNHTDANVLITPLPAPGPS